MIDKVTSLDLSFTTFLCDRNPYYLYFAAEETEDQRGCVTCLRSHSNFKAQGKELRWEPGDGMLSLSWPLTSSWQVSRGGAASWDRSIPSRPHWAYGFSLSNLRLVIDSSEGDVNIPQEYIPQHPVKKENTMMHQEVLWTQPEKLEWSYRGRVFF